ncbi:hypothetical protein PVAP13_6KG372500 [Panicum virgatum]|uniref:BTB domain-containing protein n=1 Tax=Panicum virgatum TaxID=38727 RepID=A0A8T0RGM6_PANVG|nr:hypothetical protein PVAP13_6KG372500 [Panicum virgatum]
MSSESGSVVEFKLDYSGTKNLAIGEAVYSKNFSAGGHLWRINSGKRTIATAAAEEVVYEVIAEPRDRQEQAQKEVHKDSAQGPVDPSFEQQLEVKRSRVTLRHQRPGDDHVRGHRLARRRPPGRPALRHTQRPWRPVGFRGRFRRFIHRQRRGVPRSPIFKAQLLGSMADAKMASITLHDIAPAMFKVMLRFRYTDDLLQDEDEDDDDNDADSDEDDDDDHDDDELGLRGHATKKLQDLLAAADRYALDHLKLLCASKLWDNISVDTVASTLACAEMYNCPELQKRCIDFFADEKNFKKAVLTDDFAQLVLKFPSILAELRMKVRV